MERYFILAGVPHESKTGQWIKWEDAEQQIADLTRQLAEARGKCGEAEAELANESDVFADICKQWQDKAETAEADNERLRERLRPVEEVYKENEAGINIMSGSSSIIGLMATQPEKFEKMCIAVAKAIKQAKGQGE
jgi:hypothetical protein